MGQNKGHLRNVPGAGHKFTDKIPSLIVSGTVVIQKTLEFLRLLYEMSVESPGKRHMILIKEIGDSQKILGAFLSQFKEIFFS